MLHQPLEQQLHQAHKHQWLLIQLQVINIIIEKLVCFEVPYFPLHFFRRCHFKAWNILECCIIIIIIIIIIISNLLL